MEAFSSLFVNGLMQFFLQVQGSMMSVVSYVKSTNTLYRKKIDKYQAERLACLVHAI
jgi:hypothetical protein